MAAFQEELQGVVRRMFEEESAKDSTQPMAAPVPVNSGLSDGEIIQKALAASNRERFSRLWNGDADQYGSHSEADLALCGMLAFWTGGDASRIDALFRQSGLYREKASQVKEEAEDAGISERTLARAKKAVGVMSYREGETGERGKGQWLWKLPVVDLVDDIKDATSTIEDAKGCQNNYGGILNHVEGCEKAEYGIDKPNILRMPPTEENPIKDAISIKDANGRRGWHS